MFQASARPTDTISQHWRDFEDLEEGVTVFSAYTATQKAIETMLESEAEDLQWTGPPTFLGVAKIVLSMIVMDPGWPRLSWRTIDQGWVDERLGRIEDHVANCVGEDRLWSEREMLAQV